MIDQITEFIQNFIKKYNYNGAVIGISGGIDSAVAGKLVVDSIGSESVLGLLLPERDSAPMTLKDSKIVCEFLGIQYNIINMTKILRKMGVYRMHPPAKIFPRKVQENYVRKVWRLEEEEKEDPFILDLSNRGSSKFIRGQAFYRAKHRLRMVMLYLEAEKRNYAVVCCANKTENLSGFFVKWGDDSADFAPILHLYKGQVYDIARKLKIPERIINKAPSPDLVPGLTDEFVLGISYENLDRILIKIENGEDLSEEDSILVNKVNLILEHAKYRKIKSEHL